MSCPQIMKEFGASIDIPENRMMEGVIRTEEIRLRNFVTNQIRKEGFNPLDFEWMAERDSHFFGMTLRIRAKPIGLS